MTCIFVVNSNFTINLSVDYSHHFYIFLPFSSSYILLGSLFSLPLIHTFYRYLLFLEFTGACSGHQWGRLHPFLYDYAE